MENKIKIISDSSCDYTKEEMKSKNVEVIPFYVSYDSKEYFKENTQLSTPEFYKKIIDNPDYSPKSSCPSTGDYLEVYKKYVEAGYKIIVLCITSKFSGSYNSASLAKDMLLEENSEARIEVIDTKVNTVLQGILVDEVVKMVNDKLEFDDIVNKTNELKETGKIYFTIQNLTYLLKGGRIGKVAAIIANIANLRPLICLDEGDIHAFGIAFGRKKSIQKVFDKFVSHFSEKNLDYNEYSIVVGYGNDIEEGKQLLEKIKEYIGSKVKNVQIKLAQIGSTIAVHTGPYPLGVAFVKKYSM